MEPLFSRWGLAEKQVQGVTGACYKSALMSESSALPPRAEAVAVLEQYIQNESLRKHCRTVEAAMRWFARQAGEDEELWGMVGLLHDLDYEQFPEQHCHKTVEILAAWPEVVRRAIMSHGWQICTDVEPQSRMEKTLYTIDELTGLITACALVRPSKSVRDVDADSVMKKFKTASFAAKVDRSVIERGAGMMGLELRALVELTLQAMQEQAEVIGLAGN